MQDALTDEASFFSIKTPYIHEALEVQKSHFVKEKTKHFSIIQKEQLICKLHSHILEEEFDLTFMLFETNQLSIPEEFNPAFVEILVKYFYFKEIHPIALQDIFQFFHLACDLKVESITKEIIEFLKGNLNDIKKAKLIYKGAFEFAYFFKEPYNFPVATSQNSIVPFKLALTMYLESCVTSRLFTAELQKYEPTLSPVYAAQRFTRLSAEPVKNKSPSKLNFTTLIGFSCPRNNKGFIRALNR